MTIFASKTVWCQDLTMDLAIPPAMVLVCYKFGTVLE